MLENVPLLLTLTHTLVGYSCTKDILVSVEQMKRDRMDAKTTVPSKRILQENKQEPFANTATFMTIMYVWLLADRLALYLRHTDVIGICTN